MTSMHLNRVAGLQPAAVVTASGLTAEDAQTSLEACQTAFFAPNRSNRNPAGSAWETYGAPVNDDNILIPATNSATLYRVIGP